MELFLNKEELESLVTLYFAYEYDKDVEVTIASVNAGNDNKTLGAVVKDLDTSGEKKLDAEAIKEVVTKMIEKDGSLVNGITIDTRGVRVDVTKQLKNTSKR